uniref:Large ribosomal subunit protein uL22 n=1 Tax=Ignisphaera aggregans TaxID=334771 RepID=A0A7C2VLX0_9CREN
MPVWHYPKLRGFDESKIAKAVIRDAPISFKEAYEVCRVLRGMSLNQAKELLNRVLAFKEPIPYARYKLSIAHKKGLGRRWKTPVGRYPVKVCRYVLKLLENVENNAATKGLDTSRLKIVHIAAHRGPYLKRWTPRAFGRATAWFRTHTSVEVIVAEV